MARDPDTIEREIEQARDALATTLDQLSVRAHPKRFVETGSEAVRHKLDDPKIKLPLIGFGVLVALTLVRRLFR
ncbi:DUF3618 domain-containing protein [Allokutzneria oryzae]|uniref:DUF3618 domain-containing protein n=1 Tax=Allokutzneria oryzae TaxID=1378989 RepID=A0ABV5ZVL7_9PSEU